MKRFLTFLCILLTLATLPARAASNTFIDYQNFNHGYCPDCNCYPCRCAQEQPLCEPNAPPGAPPCPPGAVTPSPVPGNPPVCNTCKPPDPCNPAPVCGTNCGISLCCLGLLIGSLAAAGAIIIGANNGRDPSH